MPISRNFGVPPQLAHFCVGSVVLHSLHFLSWFVVFFVSHLLIVPVLCAAASVHL